jgi:hypothetical protein
MSIKQSNREAVASQNGSTNSAPACWQRERDRDCLRVEMRPGEVFLLPYQQFVLAHLQQEDGKDVLGISFSSHQLTLEGRHLDEIISALQDFAVDWLSPTPARYRSLRDESSAMIAKITIEAAE